jgi:hypothetical protein
VIVCQLRRTNTLLAEQLSQSCEEDFQPCRLRRLRQEQAMLGAVRSGRLRVKFQPDSRAARPMRL